MCTFKYFKSTTSNLYGETGRYPMHINCCFTRIITLFSKIAQKPIEQNCTYCVQIFVFKIFQQKYNNQWLACVQRIFNLFGFNISDMTKILPIQTRLLPL